MKLFILLAFILNAFCLSGQVITGKVTNEKKEAISYANVVFLSKDRQTFIKGATTNEQGVFSVSGISSSDKENVLIKISCLGYSSLELDLLSLSNAPITLKDDTELLDEVVVKAKKIPYKMHQGVLIANVRNSSLSTLGTANDVIGKLPFVTGKDANFTVFGKGTPQIYINNRLVRDNSELGLLTSKEIKDIAVITTPDSEYDASVGAVIKITTIRPQGEGFSGSFSTSAGRGEQLQGLISTSLNYRIKNWDLFATGGYNRSNRENHSKQKQAFIYDNKELTQSSVQNQRIEGNNYFPGIGFNFIPNSNHSLGVSYKGVFANTELPSHLDITTQTSSDKIEYQEQLNLNNNKNHQHILNGYYSAKLSNKLKLDLTTDIVTGGQKLLQYTSFANETSESININSKSSFDVYMGKAILEYASHIGNLRFGAEYTKTNFKQSYETDRTDIGLMNSSDESLQNRFSAFSSYRAKISDWGFNAGIRYEFIKGRYYSNEELKEEQSPVYHYFFPSISVSYEPRAYQITLSYNPRVTYPSYTQLRNFAQYTSPFVYESGNPNLQPVLKHIIQLSVMRKNIRLMGSYTINKRMIYPIMYVMEDRPVIMRMYDNLKTMRATNIVASYSLNVGCWESMWEFGINKQWLDIADMSYNKPRWTYKWQNNFKLPKRYSLRVDFSGNSKGNSGLAYYNKSSYSLDFNISKSFDNLDVNLSVNDIFHTAGQRWDILYNSINWNEDKYFDSRNVRLSLSYRFNATNKRYQGRTENDELNRLY